MVSLLGPAGKLATPASKPSASHKTGHHDNEDTAPGLSALQSFGRNSQRSDANDERHLVTPKCYDSTGT